MALQPTRSNILADNTSSPAAANMYTHTRRPRRQGTMRMPMPWPERQPYHAAAPTRITCTRAATRLHMEGRLNPPTAGPLPYPGTWSCRRRRAHTGT